MGKQNAPAGICRWIAFSIFAGSEIFVKFAGKYFVKFEGEYFFNICEIL